MNINDQLDIDAENNHLNSNLIEYIDKCIINLKYLSTLDLEKLLLNLFKNSNKPLNLEEIYDAICILRNIEKEDLKNILLNDPSFKLVEFETWALKEWTQYEEIIINFENYIEYIKNNFKETHWKCFEDYNLTDTKETFNSIGKKLNISKQRVGQIINSVIVKLNNTPYRKHPDYHIKVLKKILNDNEYILIDNYPEEYRKVFGNWNIRKVVTFLNMMGGDFICYKDKYFICNEKILEITNILEKKSLSISTEEICEAYINDIIKINNLNENIEKEILLDCIKQDKRYFLCKDHEKIFYAKYDISITDILYMILHELKEPATNRFLSKQYTSVTGKISNYDSFNFHLERDNRFINLYDNVYGLSCLKYDENNIHVQDISTLKKRNPREHIVNLVIDVLSEHQGSMNYQFIYEQIRDKTSASKHYMRKALDNDPRIQELLSGFYTLRDAK